MAKLAILETKARYIGSTLESEQATGGGERFRAGQHGCDIAICAVQRDYVTSNPAQKIAKAKVFAGSIPAAASFHFRSVRLRSGQVFRFPVFD